MLIKSFFKRNPFTCSHYIVIKPKKFPLFCFSDWKQKQDLKKKIMDANEAEKIVFEINKRNMNFSILAGSFFFYLI